MFTFPQTGATPLYIAAQNNCVKTAEVLLSAGANPNLALKVGFVSCLSVVNFVSLAAYVVCIKYVWRVALMFRCCANTHWLEITCFTCHCDLGQNCDMYVYDYTAFTSSSFHVEHVGPFFS